MKQQIGLIGLAVMGKNLALNIESRGFSVCVFNRSREKTDELIDEAKGRNIKPAYTIEEFAASLEKPRKIIIMVKAGAAVDETIQSLTPYLEKGDLIIDGGNSYFEDTARRFRQLKDQGFNFIGTGISGGEEGALKGPAIMPGGSLEAYKMIEPVLTAIAAKVEGEPCCAYIGPDGAGHYVKMVHNGIEYADMQLISEAYSILKNIGGLDAAELHNVFSTWNKGELDSYLIEITADIFTKIDNETGKPVVDIILDSAGQKGTGKWTSQSALDLEVCAPTIAEAVFARYISSLKQQRVQASKSIKPPIKKIIDISKNELIESVRRALYASKICSYAQGFDLMKNASDKYGWNLKLSDIAMIFRGGCIIRARFLHKINEAYLKKPELCNLMLDDYFKYILEQYQEDFRKIVSISMLNGIPCPAFASALSYFDSYRTERLPVNLLQAQRDYFGAHTFERIDREGVFHYKWF